MSHPSLASRAPLSSQNLSPDYLATQDLQICSLGFTVTSTLCLLPLAILCHGCFSPSLAWFIASAHLCFHIWKSSSNPQSLALHTAYVSQSCVYLPPRLSASSWKERVASRYCYIADTWQTACLQVFFYHKPCLSLCLTIRMYE